MQHALQTYSAAMSFTPCPTAALPPRLSSALRTMRHLGMAAAVAAGLTSISTHAVANTAVDAGTNTNKLTGNLNSNLKSAPDTTAAEGVSLDGQVRQFALSGMRQAAPGVTRIEIEVGRLDARLKLAPCQRVEPYLPAGTQLWGKTRVGLRCTLGPRAWNVFLPLTVKAFGPMLVAAHPLPAGSVLSASDFTQGEADLAENPSAALTDSDLVSGRSLARAVAAGEGLRMVHLKPRQWFAPGDVVRVWAVGPGFAVASQGEAMTAGMEGQTARVRTQNGRVVSGMPVAERRLELPL